MRKLLLLVAFAIAMPLLAAPLPPWAGFPATLKSDDAWEVTEAFGKETFPMPGDKPELTVEGKHYAAQLRGEPGLEASAAWAKLRPVLVGKGWKVINDDGSTKVLRMESGAHDAWMKVDVFGSDDIRVSLIERSAQTVVLRLPPPAAKPESVGPQADFPYLARYPGSQLKQTEVEKGPMDVTTSADAEPQLAGTASTVKFYTVPEGLSAHQFTAVYRDALNAAGWTIASVTDAGLLARYAKNGRDLWASLSFNPDDLALRVSEGSVGDLAKQLERACHVPLYGIHFDFNRATLRPDSEPLLQQVAASLKGAPSLAVEIQGHTDAVGGDASNQKLSEARAESVRSWLVAHGVAASRVTAHGYGKSRPVATNDTDAGRARNRRVEIAKTGCKE